MQAASEDFHAMLRGQSFEQNQPYAKRRSRADLMCAYPGSADERNQQETAVPWAYGQARGRPASPKGWRISSAGLQRPSPAQHIPGSALFTQITTPLQQTLPP